MQAGIAACNMTYASKLLDKTDRALTWLHPGAKQCDQEIDEIPLPEPCL